MKTFKKVLVLCLLVVFTLTLLVACGDETTAEDVKFTITYDLNINDGNAHFAGSLDNSTTLEVEYLNGQRIEAPNKPVCKGYDFIGWFFDKEPKEGEKPVPFKYQWFDKDTTLYARWAKKQAYTVNFYINTGSELVLVKSFENMNKDEKTSATELNDATNKVIEEKNLTVNPIYVAVKEGAEHLEIAKNQAVKIKDITEYADDKNAVDFVMNTVEIQEFRYFQYGTNKIATVVCTKDADGNLKMDIKSAFKKDANGKLVLLADDKFELDENGNRLMPMIIDYNIDGVNGYNGRHSTVKGRYFKHWQVKYNAKYNNYATEPIGYYNNEGFKLQKDNATGEYKPTKLNLFSENVDYIDTISCIEDTWDCEVTYYDRYVDKATGETHNTKIATKVYKYGNTGLASQGNVIQQIHPGLELSCWRYQNNYADTGVSKGQKVDDTNVIKDRKVEIYSDFIEKEKQVKFEIGKNQFFDTTQSTGTVIEKSLKELEDFIQNPTSNVLQDTFYSVLNAYYINPTIVTPTTIDRATLDATTNGKLIKQAIENAEREANRKQKDLLGYALKDNGRGEGKVDLLLKKEILDSAKGTYKFVATKTLDDLYKDIKTGKYDKDFITLEPVFGKFVNGNPVIAKGVDNLVTISKEGKLQNEKGKIIGNIDCSFTIGDGNEKPETIKLYSQANKGNSTGIADYKANALGYKFTGKWIVASTIFSGATEEVDGFDGSLFDGVIFDANYPLLGDVVIQPVFEITKYNIKFVNNINATEITEAKFTGDKNVKLLKNNQSIKDAENRVIKTYIDKLYPNLETDEEKLAEFNKYYQFDDWYTTIKNADGTTQNISLTKFDGTFNQELVFKPRFIDRTFNIQYKYIDIDKLVANRNNISSYKDLYLNHQDLFIDGALQKDAFDINGAKGKYTDKFGNVHDYSDVLDLSSYCNKKHPNYDVNSPEYKMYNEFKYSTTLGDANYIIGWQYFDVINNKWTSFTNKTSVAEGKADIKYNEKDGYYIEVYPLFKEFNVKIDLDGNGAVLELPDGTSVFNYSVKGGYFGADLASIEKFNGFTSEVKLTRDGYKFTGNWLWKVTEKDKVTEEDVVSYPPYNGSLKDGGNPKIADDITLWAEWETVNYDVTVKYVDTKNNNRTSSIDKTEVFVGNIEGIYEKNAELLPNKDKLIHIQDLVNFANSVFPYYDVTRTDFAKGVKTLYSSGANNNPTDMYDVAVYVTNSKGKKSKVTTLDTARDVLTVEVELTYRDLGLALNANGGKFRGTNTSGHDVLEQFVDEKCVLTTTKENSSIKSAYVTKNDVVGGRDFVDQGIPVRPGYIFGGFVVGKENADNLGADYKIDTTSPQIFFGYDDASDVLANGDAKLREQVKAKGLFIGAEDFRTDAGELVFNKVVTDKNEKIVVSELFAVWIPIKAQITYCDESGAPFTKIDGTNEQAVIDRVNNLHSVNKAPTTSEVKGFKSLLNPGEKIQNPYQYNYTKGTQDKITSDDNVVTWRIHKDYKDTIDAGVIASEHPLFVNEVNSRLQNTDNPLTLQNGSYVCNFNVYRQINQAKTEVDLTYKADGTVLTSDKEIKGINLADHKQNHFINKFSERVTAKNGDLYYMHDDYIKIGAGEYLGYLLRKTYYVEELSNPQTGEYRYIDQMQYSTGYEISGFLNGVNGVLTKQEKDGKIEYVYKKSLTIKPTLTDAEMEKLPIKVHTRYLINNVETKVKDGYYNLPMVNPFFDDVFISYKDYQLKSNADKESFVNSGMFIDGYMYDDTTKDYKQVDNNKYLATKFKAVYEGGKYAIQRLNWYADSKFTNCLVNNFYTNDNKVLANNVTLIDDLTAVTDTFVESKMDVQRSRIPVHTQVENGVVMFNAKVYGRWEDVTNSKVTINSSYWEKANPTDANFTQFGSVLKSEVTPGESQTQVFITNPTSDIKNSEYPTKDNGLKDARRKSWTYKGNFIDTTDETKTIPTLAVEGVADGSIFPVKVTVNAQGGVDVEYNIDLYFGWAQESRQKPKTV